MPSGPLNIRSLLLGAIARRTPTIYVDSDPSGVLIRRAGTMALLRGETAAWLNVDGTATGWVDCALFGELAGSWLAGWRPGKVIHNTAVNGAAVTVLGLSSAKRYRLEWTANDNGATETLHIQPNGADAGCICSVDVDNGTIVLGQPFLGAYVCFAGRSTRRNSAVIEPRVDGKSYCHVNTANCAIEAAAGIAISTSGETTTDFTSLAVQFSATARTGWLLMIEESP